MDLLKHTDLPAWLIRKFGSASAVAAAMGVTRQTAHNLISGRTVPSYETCEKLGLYPAYFLAEKETQQEMTSLDDFLSKRENDRGLQGVMAETGMGEAPLESERGAAMWKDLIKATRAISVRLGAIDGQPFEWDGGQPHGKSNYPQLKLGPVGAEFSDAKFSSVLGLPRACRIVFGWVPTPQGFRNAGMPNRHWNLTLSAARGVISWNVNSDEIVGVSSAELAEQAVKQLIVYRDDYESAGSNRGDAVLS
jgi:hypothetical protein